VIPERIIFVSRGITVHERDCRIHLDRLQNKTNTQIAKELKITQILDKLLEYKRNWIQHVNRMPCNTRVINTIPQLAEGIMADLGRDFWIRETGNGSTSGPTQ